MSASSERRSHEDRILWQLQAAFPSWVPALTLSRISLQYNARVFGLRRKGWQIESRVQIVNGVRHGSFRLATPRTFPNPRARAEKNMAPGESKNKSTGARQHIESALPATGSGLLFTLPERIHPYPD